MRTSRGWRWVVTLLALALLAGACGDADGGETAAAGAPSDQAGGDQATQAEPASDEPIVIGGTLGLTGAFSGPSAGYKATYDWWLERVNASGGLLGRPVEMIIYDDESTPATAQALYQRLVNEDQVDLLLAPYTTAVGGAVIPIAERNEMVLWNGGFVGIDLFKNSDWIVGAYTYQEPEYPRGIFEMIDALPEAERPARVGVVTAQNPFTLVVRDGFEGEGGVLNEAAERGMQVVLNEEYAMQTTDVSALIQRAKSEGVEMFFALSLPNDAALIARTAQEQGFDPTIYCSCGSQVTTLPFWKDLGPAGDGVMATAMAWPTDGHPGLKELDEHLRRELGYEQLPAYGTVALSILQVLQQAVEGVGSLDQAALRDHVTGRSFETANGTITYDEDRIPSYNAIVVQYLGDHNEVVWPPDRATAQPRVPMGR